MASAQSTAPDPTSVYRYYDRAGMLIYVGITRQGMGRNLQHNRNADWWQYVSRQEVEHYETRPVAAKREKELIRRYRPPFNKQHNLGHAELRAAYMSYAGKDVEAANPLELYRLLGKELPLDVISRTDDEIVFRSRLEHDALALMMRPAQTTVPLSPGRRGRVLDLMHSGRFVFVRCRIKDAVPVRSALARLAYKMDTKPAYARLDKIVLVDGVA